MTDVYAEFAEKLIANSAAIDNQLYLRRGPWYKFMLDIVRSNPQVRVIDLTLPKYGGLVAQFHKRKRDLGDGDSRRMVFEYITIIDAGSGTEPA